MRNSITAAQFFCASNRTPAKVFGALAAAALFLTACTSTAGHLASPADGCDYQGPSGICVHVDPDAKPFNPSRLDAAYMQAKRDVEARYHLDLEDVPGPVVRVMSVPDFARLHPIHNRVDGDLGGDHGWTGFETGEIMITGPAVMRHESFHYLLWKAGYPNRLNAVHDHPAFDEYRDGNWLPKRASQPSPTTVTQKSQADPS